MAKRILLIAVLWPLTALGQSLVTVSPQQCVWRAGDDPAWAAPNLDETGWQPSSLWKLPLEEPHLWARCQADLGALRGTAHPAIQISLAGAYQLFVNGERIGGAGNVRTGFYSMDTIRQYPLPTAALQTQPDTIGLRITLREPIITTSPLEIHAGDLEALTGRRAGFVLAQSESNLAIDTCYAMIGVVGLMLLGLFCYDRSRRELLYLSIICANRAALGILEHFSVAQMNLPWVLSSAILDAVNAVDPVVFVLFFFALARRRVPRIYWLPVVIAAAQSALPGFALLLPAGQSLWLTGKVLDASAIFVLFSVAWMVSAASPFIAFWPYSQISRRMRPLAALCLMHGAFSTFWNAVQMTADPRLGLPNLFVEWQRGFLDIYAFVTACVLIGLLGLLFRDQRQVTEERALLAGEMQAASEIQHMLAPAKIDTAPGLHIDVAFHPMRDVGGDFYFCRVLADRRQRVVVGDVSGKGAAAAMAATLLLGAASARESDSPAVLLAQLNQVLCDSHVGGFATCLCADFTAAGEVSFANAGHLSPYCNSREIELRSSLPLGIAAAAEYTETTLRLSSGETLTLLSDGVVEARNTAGELFGFERTRAISNQSAAAIAEAAMNFGQEDDITVLNVTFASLDVAHA